MEILPEFTHSHQLILSRACTVLFHSNTATSINYSPHVYHYLHKKMEY